MTKTEKKIPFPQLYDTAKKINGTGILLKPERVPELRNVSVIVHSLKTTLEAPHFSCFHDLFVLKIHLSGQSKGYVENNVYDFLPGEGFLIFPFQMHKIISTNPKGQLRLVFNFTTSPEDLLLFEPLRNKIFKISFENSVELKRIVEMTKKKTASAHREAISLLTDFLLKQIEKNRDRPDSQSVAGTPFKKVFDYLHAHYREGLTVKELADKFGYSETGIRLIFRKETGRTPGAFMQELALHDAAEKLSSTNKSIQMISQECGFSNPYIFSRAFKNKIGKSPKAFRADVRNPQL